jgi:hypothetical protein
MIVEQAENEEVIDNGPQQEIAPIFQENEVENDDDVKEIIITPSNEEPNKLLNEKDDKPTLNDDIVLSYLKEQKGFNAESFEDLKPKELKKFNAIAEKFNDYIDKTGNENIQDFLETQKDWTQVEEKVKLREFLKIQNPKLSDTLIDHLFEESYVYDEDYDDDRTIKSKQIKVIQDVEKAEQLLEERKREFEVKRGSDALIPEDYKQAKAIVDDLRQNELNFQQAQKVVLDSYKEKAEKVFTNEFKGFKQQVGNDTIGKFEITIKPENNQVAKEWHSNPANLNDKFFNKDGMIVNDDYYAIAEIARVGKDKFLTDFANTAIAEYIKAEAKASKNITDGVRPVHPAYSKSIKVERA